MSTKVGTFKLNRVGIFSTCFNLLTAAGLVLMTWSISAQPEPKTSLRLAEPPLSIEELIEGEGEAKPDPCSLSMVICDDEAAMVPERELHWLTKAVYFEARNESGAGQVAVAIIVLNRVADPRWPDTIEAVVRQGEERRHRCQFSFMCDGEPETVSEPEAWQAAEVSAKRALRRWEAGDRMGNAHSYHADYVTSESALRWFTTLEKEGRIGTHLFYRDQHS
jgi:spore germination cell wall hydrolase CwlJ-like protein